jgi:putative ABC transport system substrate-binding protein
MKISADQSLAMLRLGLGVVILLGSAPTWATPEPLPQVAYPDQHKPVNPILFHIDADGGLSPNSYERNRLTLAQLTDQLKKQNILTSDSIAVIFPDFPEPFRDVFTKMIEGIEKQTKLKVRSFPISEKFDAADLNAQLKRNGTKVVIALGSRGLKISANFDRDISVVVGGIFSSIPEVESNRLLGISLTPDPALLFSMLKDLLPNVKRVIVIYNPQTSEWQLKLAHAAAKTQGLELITHEAHDLGTSGRLYESVFATADSKTDAVWLPQDSSTVDENTILPIILKESWNHSIPFFSSSFSHVKKGALFALQPNNLELGRNLANSALGILAGESPKRGMSPLRDVQTAFNVRTASHIGLNIGEQQQRNFNYIFPEP